MSNLTTTSQLRREAQMVEVMGLLYANPDWTVTQACEHVSIATTTFYEWFHKSPHVIDSMRGLIGDQQREILLKVTAARARAVEHLIEDATAQNTSTKDRVLAQRYLDEIREELERSHHASPGVEEDAYSFLKEGPIIEKKKSRLASVAIREGDDGDVTLDIYRDQDVIDITPQDVEEG